MATAAEILAPAVAAVQEALDARDTRIAELEARLRPPTVFGTSRPDLTPGLTWPVPAVRTYLQPRQRPTAVTADAGLRRAFAQVSGSGLVWLSIKEDAGTWLDLLLTDAEARFPDVTIIATADHEPKSGWWDTGRIAEWQARQAALEDVLADHPSVEGWTVVEGSASAVAGYWEAVVREKQGFGVDSYNPGIQSPRAYVPPAEVHGPRFDRVRALGRTRTAVAETGTGVVAGDKGRAGQSRWVADNRAYLAGAEEVRAALWWNSGAGGPSGTGCTLTSAQMTTWFGSPG